ncbi:ET module [Ancylostoma ceylanicum]|uniref:ET module n=1 Tax=Ancylostoma ceylanicum TaxID=53326 RepID=A0A0D6LEH5_9BILA|nr:ET module [Ancylostoma ceylanicum]
MCDPTAICKALKMTNKCATVEQGLSGCCCDTDACIYPPRNRNPGNQLQCYVGLYAPKAGVNVGAEVACDGQCSSLNGIVNGDNVTTFQCVPLSLCKSVNSGISLGQSKSTRNLFRSLELDNACGSLPTDREISACCCDGSNSCNVANYTNIIPPTVSPVAEYPISCWTGVYVNGNAITKAGFRTCFGECASITLQTTIGSTAHNATMYMCDPTAVCRALNMTNQCSTVEPGVSGCCCNTDACLTPQKNPDNKLTCYVGMYAKKANINTGAEVSLLTLFASIGFLAVNNGCTSLPGDREASACCCDFANACNVLNRTDIAIPTPSPVPEFPISCWSGVYVNGNALTNVGFQTCNGECASFTLTTSINNVTHNAAIYTCDPTSVCSSMGMINNCVTVETGVQGCCCNTDGCLTPNKKPGNVLWCYVGLYAKNAGVNVGGEVVCDGQCSSLSGMVNGDNVTTFQCVPTSVCKSLAANNGCVKLPTDREVQGCCCDGSNSCNLYQLNRTDEREAQSGVVTDSNRATENAPACLYKPRLASNSTTQQSICATRQPSARDSSPATNPLMCYVGINAPKAGVNVGAEVPCNGMCSTLNAIVNGDNVTTFQCAPTSVCKALVAYNSCNTLKGDREVTGCCCDGSNACNLASRPDIVAPTPAPVSEYPISCWAGVYVNGNALSNPGFTTCFGECASVTLNTTMNNQTHTANMSNQCSTVEPGLGGCCCNTDACLNPVTNTFPGNDLICYVGIYYEKDNYTVGSEVKCNGKCASLQTTFAGKKFKSYHCAPTPICKALTVDNSCGPVYKDSDVTACCCDTGKNCNVQEPISTNNTAPAFTGTPIACQSGIFVDGAPVTSNK